MSNLGRGPIGCLVCAWATTLLTAGQSVDDRLAAIKKHIRQSPVFDFGKVRQDDPVEHVFQFRNSGTDTLQVKNIQLTPPLALEKMSRQIEPGETTAVSVRLGQPRRHGDFEGIIIVHFTNAEAMPAFFRVQGRVVGSIEFEPMRAFFVTAFKGERAERSIEIANYERSPLALGILKAEQEDAPFTTELATIEPGRRYRLTLNTKAGAPAGSTQHTIRLSTSNPQHSVIQVPANVQIRERVYTFPGLIALGRIDRAALGESGEAASLTQSFTVYQRDGKDFQIDVATALPFLRLTKRQAGLVDRYEVQVEVVREKLQPGPIQGSIRVTTNDPEFPRLEIPVNGEVAPMPSPGAAGGSMQSGPPK